MSPARLAVYILVSPVIFWWYQCEINLAHIPYCCFNTVMNIPSYCPDAFPSPGSHAHVWPQNELTHHLPPELVEGYLLHLLPLYKYYIYLYIYIVIIHPRIGWRGSSQPRRHGWIRGNVQRFALRVYDFQKGLMLVGWSLQGRYVCAI